MKLETSKNKITIILEGEKPKEIQIADLDFGESTKQIWIKLIKK